MSRDETGASDGQDADGGVKRAYLQRFLQENATNLLTIICGYVMRMGVARSENIETVAAEIFQEAVIETLTHANRFNLEMQPRAWFLAIAANILKRHRARYAKRYRFEILLGDLVNEPDILDNLMNSHGDVPEPEREVVERESVQEMLALVSPEDARLLNMALIQGWDAKALASVMGVTPGTARVRIHRALGRLREAWRTSEQRKEHDKLNG